MKQKILYILLMITALLGGNAEAWAQSGYISKSIVTDYYADVKTLDNNLSSGRITLTNSTNINNTTFTSTFTIGDNLNGKSGDGIELKIGSGKRTNTINYSLSDPTIYNVAFKLTGFELSMHSTSKIDIKISPSSGTSKIWTLPDLIEAVSNSFTAEELNSSQSISISLESGTTWMGPWAYLRSVKFTYTLSYYELDISALNTAIKDAEKISVNDLGGFTKTAFTNALEKANTVKAESVFPTSYWDGSNSQGKQNPTNVNNATSAFRGALELANAYIAAKAEINNLKTQGDSWPKGLYVNIDNALTALDNATDINGINNAKNQIGIVLERNLPANRYFTLTLPFNYNLNGITDGTNVAYAAQLAFVTHNEHDCYTLYFKKVDGGQMLANQPYIVWLPIGFDKPDFGNVAVNFGEASSITENGWIMQGNYSQLSMTDKFGIAEGLFRKGGAGSTINAYTAYFIPPTHSHGTQNVRARVAVMEEGGNTTYIGELKDGVLQTEEGIYGLDGVQQNQLRKGINIVRMKDGKVRKILK